MGKSKEYIPTATGEKFHNSSAKFKAICGPVGSGKTTICIVDLAFLAHEQIPSKDGVRRTKWLVVRNTYPQLEETVIASFKMWFPPNSITFKMSKSPIEAVYKTKLPDGTSVEAKFLFMAMENPNAIENMKSLELTGFYINEGRYISERVLSNICERMRRYPPTTEKPDDVSIDEWRRTCKGIMDTNPPSNSHWWYKKAEIEKPKGWEFFRQPPGVVKNEKGEYVFNDGTVDHRYSCAENLIGHSGSRYDISGAKEYYEDQLTTKNEMEIRVDLCGEYGVLMEGKPVWSGYSDDWHVSKEPIPIYRGLPLILGTDNGRTPATVVCQIAPNGQFRVLREIYTSGMGASTFIDKCVKEALREFDGMSRVNYCDPACNAKSQLDENSILDIWNRMGIASKIAPVKGNLLAPRLDAVDKLMRDTVATEKGIQPRFVIDPSCSFLREALQGGYYLEIKKGVGVADEFKEVPAKNKYSHICDALQYAAISIDADYAPISKGNFNTGLTKSKKAKSYVW